MTKVNLKEKLHKLFMEYLGIFAGEDQFIHSHRGKSSMLKEQERYGTQEKEK